MALRSGHAGLPVCPPVPPGYSTDDCCVSMNETIGEPLSAISAVAMLLSAKCIPVTVQKMPSKPFCQ